MSAPPSWRVLPGESIAELLRTWQRTKWSWDAADVDTVLDALGWHVVRRSGRMLQVDTGLGVGGGYGSFLFHGGRIARLTVRVSDVVPAEEDRAAREFLLDAFAGVAAATEIALGAPTARVPGDMAEVRWQLVPVTVRVEMIRVAVDLVLAETSYVAWQEESERVLANLGDARDGAAVPSPAPESPAAPPPAATPASPATPATGPSPGAPPGPAPASPPAPARSRSVSRPDIMQKVVPHGLVGYYLDQGYDRIAGYVYRWEDVRSLDTPAKLFDVLGLGYAGSPFSRKDPAMHVVRWPAYGAALYRPALGGTDDGQMRSVPGGWVIERPPFTGNGYAPSREMTIPQLKVDSIRVPHRAEIWRIDASGDQEFVAAYDCDRWKWVRPPEEVR